MNRRTATPTRFDAPEAPNMLSARVVPWLARHSVALLRISLGLVFLGFGLLKFVPGLSPAETLAERTTEVLTFGLVSGRAAGLLVATLETTIGLCLLTGRALRLGLALLGLAMVGVLSPLLLFPAELFAGPGFAPTLEGQYVLKDVVLLASVPVIAARAHEGRRIGGGPPEAERADRA